MLRSDAVIGFSFVQQLPLLHDKLQLFDFLPQGRFLHGPVLGHLPNPSLIHFSIAYHAGLGA